MNKQSYKCPVCEEVYSPKQEPYTIADIAYCLHDDGTITEIFYCGCAPYFWALSYDLNGNLVKDEVNITESA